MQVIDGESLFRTPIGAVVKIKGRPCLVTGAFHERYIPTAGPIADAYALSLLRDGQREEIGIEHRGSESYLWHSRYSTQYSIDSFERVAGRLQNIEIGRIEPVEVTGTGYDYRSRYAFGSRFGKGVFLAAGENDFDVWVSEVLRPECIEL